MTRLARIGRLAVFASMLLVGVVQASTAKPCIRESCRPPGRECMRAFRDDKRAALVTCGQRAPGEVKACRRAVRTAARDGIRSCRAAIAGCVSCCRDGGDACTVAVCGDGLVEPGEACDGDASGSCTGGCRADCTCEPDTTPVCGNATVEAGEQCDASADGTCPGRCREDCTCAPAATCGNDVVEAGEACDGASHDACEVACDPECACVPAVCGNAVVGGTEECEYLADAACPGLCRFDCTCAPEPVCGNAVVEPGEECEPGVANGECDGLCLPDCRCPVCGDGIIDAPTEVCEATDDAACPGVCSTYSCNCLSPTTDTCEAPREIASLPDVDRQLTALATTAPTDPLFGCLSVGSPVQHEHSVWYALTAPATGRVQADTAGSSYDTLLGAYTGTCDTPTPVACNDDPEFGVRARIDFAVTEGTRYLIEAAAYTGEGGGELLLALDFRPCGDGVVDAGEECEAAVPASCGAACSPHCECLEHPADECADAAIVTTLPVDVRVAAYESTAAASDPSIVCAFPAGAEPKSTWFRFRAPKDGTVDIRTNGSDYDTVLGLYTGACDALTVLTCNDDGGGGEKSLITTTVSAGVDYTVLVIPWRNDPPGKLQLTIAYQDE